MARTAKTVKKHEDEYYHINKENAKGWIFLIALGIWATAAIRGLLMYFGYLISELGPERAFIEMMLSIILIIGGLIFAKVMYSDCGE